ncbi:SDR family NAD(P)-dependent oxidoreductase [Rhodococcus sp. 14-2470-1a]|uniref:SDR family NAD(P)-dependent oxidoreductase n=1 Tax=Rhodococcus sp. 14-2470-1a TaxID=2023150 RepID=UPI00117A9C86|nr:SDR family oxidoreductase [Rhodococcus sp. 14-2470-1a]
MNRPVARFTDRTVIITGGASGLGLATARRFAAEGANLVIVDWNKEVLDDCVADLKLQGTKVIGVQGDVSQPDTARRAVADAVEHFGTVHVLFNNAGIDPMNARSLVETTEEEWDSILGVNLKGMFLFVREAIPVMQANGGGAIINTASSAGMKASPQESAYGISKAAIIALTRSLARDFTSSNIRSNAICPGFLEQMPSDRRAGVPDDALRARSKKAESIVPLGREGTYAEVSQSVLFLASDESSYTSGAALLMDGGWIA